MHGRWFQSSGIAWSLYNLCNLHAAAYCAAAEPRDWAIGPSDGHPASPCAPRTLCYLDTIASSLLCLSLRNSLHLSCAYQTSKSCRLSIPALLRWPTSRHQAPCYPREQADRCWSQKYASGQNDERLTSFPRHCRPCRRLLRVSSRDERQQHRGSGPRSMNSQYGIS